MSKKWPGGIITPIPATPTGPYQDGAAPGIWTLDQQAFWTKQGLWPTAGSLPPRGVFGGGATPANTSVISYVTIVTTGNAISFGNLPVSRASLAACASSTRGLFGGGQLTGIGEVNTIEYVTIATTGSSTFFGNLTQAKTNQGSCSSSTRGLFAGGSSGPSSVIDYVTIASTGSGSFFGNLNVGIQQLAACA